MPSCGHHYGVVDIIIFLKWSCRHHYLVHQPKAMLHHLDPPSLVIKEIISKCYGIMLIAKLVNQICYAAWRVSISL